MKIVGDQRFKRHSSLALHVAVESVHSWHGLDLQRIFQHVRPKICPSINEGLGTEVRSKRQVIGEDEMGENNRELAQSERLS